MFQVNSSYSVSSKPTEQILDHYIHSKEKHENCLNNILNENNQTKKNIPEGELQMLKALSYALFFSTSHAASIQKICNQQLLSMIKYDNLNEKLQFFKKNKIIYRDFCNNPCENIAFERVFYFHGYN